MAGKSRELVQATSSTGQVTSEPTLPLRQRFSARFDEVQEAFAKYQEELRLSGRLYISEPVARIPWESFWWYSFVGGFLCLVLPITMQLLYEINGIHGLEDIRNGKLNAMHATDASYLPVGLLIACVSFQVCVGAYLLCERRKRGLFVIEAQPSGNIWRWLCRGPRKLCCVQYTFLVLSALFFSALPLIAWSNRWIWNTVVLDALKQCEQSCVSTQATLRQHGKRRDSARFKDDEIFVKLCNSSKLLDLHSSKSRTSRQTWLQKWLPATANLALRTLDNIRQPMHNASKQCRRILQNDETHYLHTMVQHGGIFAVFEGRFRTAKQISALEIYGAALSISAWIMMRSSRIALRAKLATLHDARKELMLTHFMGSKAACYKYKILFQQLYRLQGNFEHDEHYFVTSVLAKADDMFDKAPNWNAEYASDEQKKVFEVGDDQDDDGVIDSFEDQKWCDKDCRENVLSGITALIFTLGHGTIPFLCRWLAMVGEDSDPWSFVGANKPIIMNQIVAGVFNFMWFRQFVHAFAGQAAKFQLAVAFDCLWRFPGDHPMKTVKRDTVPLLDEIQGYLEKLTIDDPETGERLFKENGYRAAFGVLHGEALWSELHKLEEWYHMRRYLQIDKFDERLAMELAMVVALFALLPELAIVIYNMYELKDDAYMHVNMVLLWDFAFIIVGVFRALMSTLAFNDLYDRHRKNLSALRQYIKVDMATCRSAKRCASKASRDSSRASWLPGAGTGDTDTTKTAGAGDDSAADPADGATPADALPKVYEGEKALDLVDTFVTALEEFDAPSEFLGVTVNRRVITAYASAALFVLAPQIVEIFRALCS